MRVVIEEMTDSEVAVIEVSDSEVICSVCCYRRGNMQCVSL